MYNGRDLNQIKEEIYLDLRLRLGDQMIDVESDPDHFEMAYRSALRTYRQRAQNSTQEMYTLMTMNKNQNVYTLPEEFVNVRQVFRRSVGLETGPSAQTFDPFSSAIMNTYLLNYNVAGGLATYEFFAGYVELTARMFGGYVIFTYNRVTKEIKLVRDPKGTGEQLLIWGDIQRPEAELLLDPGSGPWIIDWIFAQLKITIGEAREKFSSIVGPGGGTTLNGAAMKSEGMAAQEKLLEDLKNYVDYSNPLSFIIG
jgi:hypothetical protein